MPLNVIHGKPCTEAGLYSQLISSNDRRYLELEHDGRGVLAVFPSALLDIASASVAVAGAVERGMFFRWHKLCGVRELDRDMFEALHDEADPIAGDAIMRSFGVSDEGRALALSVSYALDSCLWLDGSLPDPPNLLVGEDGDEDRAVTFDDMRRRVAATLRGLPGDRGLSVVSRIKDACFATDEEWNELYVSNPDGLDLLVPVVSREDGVRLGAIVKACSHAFRDLSRKVEMAYRDDISPVPPADVVPLECGDMSFWGNPDGSYVA